MLYKGYFILSSGELKIVDIVMKLVLLLMPAWFILSIHEHCKLLVMLSEKNWQINDEESSFESCGSAMGRMMSCTTISEG